MSFSRACVKIIYFLEALFFKKRKSCPYCGSTDNQVVLKKALVINVCNCLNCFLYWMNPFFSFPKFYDKFYFEKDLIAAVTDIDKAKLLLSNGLKGDADNFISIARYFTELVPGRRLLEFGCSWGYFLNIASQSGFTCTGVEISEKRSDIGRKLFGATIVSDLGQLVREGRKFDVIYSAQVLEHLNKNIKEVLDYFSLLLDDNGIMVLEVPQLHPEKGRAGMLTIGAVHPLGFTGDFFLHNLPKHGFEVKVANSYGSGGSEEWMLVVYARKASGKIS